MIKMLICFYLVSAGEEVKEVKSACLLLDQHWLDWVIIVNAILWKIFGLRGHCQMI